MRRKDSGGGQEKCQQIWLISKVGRENVNDIEKKKDLNIAFEMVIEAATVEKII